MKRVASLVLALGLGVGAAGAAQLSQKIGAACVQNQHGATAGTLTCARTGATTWQWVETLPTGGKPLRNGDWLVGVEVAPGRYRSPGALNGDSSCGAVAFDKEHSTVPGGAVSTGPTEPALVYIAAGTYAISVSGCKPFVKIG